MMPPNARREHRPQARRARRRRARNRLAVDIPGGHGGIIPGFPDPGDLAPLAPIPGGALPSIPEALEEGPGALAPEIPDPFQAASDIASVIGEWLLNPERMVKLIGGGILLLMGLNRLTKAMVGTDVVGTIKHVGEAAVATKVPV